MLRTEILQIRNFIHVTVILYFHLEIMSKSVSLKILGLKLVKLDCIIYSLILIQLKKLEMSWMKPVTCLLLSFISHVNTC